MDTIRLRYVLRRDPVTGVNGITALDVENGSLYKTGHYRVSIAITMLRMLVHQQYPYKVRIEATGSVEIP